VITIQLRNSAQTYHDAVCWSQASLHPGVF